MENKIKINTYTDESGQDTKGKMFVVCTVVCLSEKVQEIDEVLAKIEKYSEKIKKWHESNNNCRKKYIDGILHEKLLSKIVIYYSRFTNKLDYLDLISGQIAKSVFDYTDENKYIAKIFMDKITKREMNNLRKEIKRYHVRYKKVCGLTEESNSFIRLADACCGLIRDLDNKNPYQSYSDLYNKMKEV